MTGAIILAADFRTHNGRFLPFCRAEGTSYIKHIINTLRNGGIGYIVVVTGFRHGDIERHLHDEGVNCVFDETYYESGCCEKIKLGVENLLSTLKSAVIIDPGISSFMLMKDTFESILFAENDELKEILENNKKPYAFEFPLNPGPAAEVSISLGPEFVLDNELFYLLELSDDTGSISFAAKAMDMSYSKAWKLIKKKEEALGEKLLEKQQGGKYGGCSRLTDKGRELISKYKLLQKELDSRLDMLNEKYFT